MATLTYFADILANNHINITGLTGCTGCTGATGEKGSDANAALWSSFPASSNVNFANKQIVGVSYIKGNGKDLVTAIH